MLEPFRVVVTAQDGEGTTQASTTPLSLTDLDGLIDIVWSQSQSQPSDSWYFLMSPKRYYQMQRALRRHRAGTIAQKERAQWKRRHREQKQARAALALRYRRRS